MIVEPFNLATVKARALPRLDWRSLLTVTEGGADPTAETCTAFDRYFSQFLLPEGGCVGCGAKQGGDAISQLMGLAAFQWGLAHGEGFCGRCGYPARALHYDVGPIKSMNVILQYHPDELIKREAE